MLNDLLVIGTGISGLTFAIKAAEQNPKLNITIISKGNISKEILDMHKEELLFMGNLQVTR